jgi:dihydrofolate reductase
MVIGGTEIFVQTMPIADRMEITIVHAAPEGDTFFPAIEPQAWTEVQKSAHPAGPHDEVAFTYITYERAGG